MKITESDAILRHIGRKHGLDGKTESEKIRIDIVQVCISPHAVLSFFIRKLYKQLFLYLIFGLVLFCQKKIGEKAAPKMLVKSTAQNVAYNFHLEFAKVCYGENFVSFFKLLCVYGFGQA